mgnify:CR=1 FL=1
MSLSESTLVRPELANLTLPQMAERYNASAALLGKPPVNRFSDKQTGIKRLEVLFKDIEALAPKTVKVGRSKRQKIFTYPPAESLKEIVPGSLRAQGRDMLLKGATLKQIEALIHDFDRTRGKPTTRAAERAYGLVRLLHTYVGYALREEGSGDNKVIFVLNREEWLAWKATR